MGEIEVRENWGLRVVVASSEGNERVVWGQELKRCQNNPHKRDDPYSSKSYHAYNRQTLQHIKAGTVVSYPDGNEFATSKVIRVIRAGCYQRVRYTVDMRRCIHAESVRVTRQMLKRARRDNRLWGAGLRPAPPTLREKHVITAATYEHLRDFIFDTDFLEPLKASEQSVQRGHCYATKEAVESTYKRYVDSTDAKEVDAVSLRVYRRVLGQKIFQKARKDHCMCTTCLRSGWRGVFENGKTIIDKMDGLCTWPVTKNADGEQVR